MSGTKGDLALVMGGGGARAAYQVGFLRHVAEKRPDLALPILTGVSAGGINAAFLAAHTQGFGEKVERLTRVWAGITADQVLRIGGIALARNVLRIGLRLVSGGLVHVARSHSFLDTTPLWRLLGGMLGSAERGLPGIAENLRSGRLKAVAITTSSYSTGQSITWIQGDHVSDWERAHRRSRSCTLTVAHVMASAALPVLFPAVQIEGAWYGDGGIRLTSPFSPAIHLGAERILAISTRYARSFEEADRPAILGYPPPAQIFGVLLNSIFLDLFDADALSLERVNRLIEAMPEERRMGMRPVRLLMLRPSRDLGLLANEYEPRLPSALRFMTRGLGTKQTRSNDLLSLLMFQPDYLARLVELGEKDARARSAEIEAFLAD